MNNDALNLLCATPCDLARAQELLGPKSQALVIGFYAELNDGGILNTWDRQMDRSAARNLSGQQSQGHVDPSQRSKP